MGKLNIAHHKSYHPYRADNIERVRRDEEEARLKEAIEDGRASLADSEARISLLRERARTESKPSRHQQQREEERLLEAGNPLIAGPSSSNHTISEEKGSGGALTLTAASGHVNFFEELEYGRQNTLEHSAKARTKAEIEKAREKELERGVPLMPDAKDRNPWYMDKSLKHPKDMTDEEIKSKEPTEPESEREKWGRRSRGSKTSSKASLDPLKDMQSHLAARSRALSSRGSANTNSMPPPAPPLISNSSAPKDAATERSTREAAERARAQALIAKRRAELDATSSVGGDTPYSARDGGYSDVYNKRETRDAHNAWERQRGRYADRRWVDEDKYRDYDRRGKSSDDQRWPDHQGLRQRDREHQRDRDTEEKRPRDMFRGERNRTRGVDDVRRRA